MFTSQGLGSVSSMSWRTMRARPPLFPKPGTGENRTRKIENVRLYVYRGNSRQKRQRPAQREGSARGTSRLDFGRHFVPPDQHGIPPNPWQTKALWLSPKVQLISVRLAHRDIAPQPLPPAPTCC